MSYYFIKLVEKFSIQNLHRRITFISSSLCYLGLIMIREVFEMLISKVITDYFYEICLEGNQSFRKKSFLK